MKTLSTALFIVASAAAPAPADNTMQLTSTAFGNDEPIPMEFSCEGQNVSPPLAWSNVPTGTKSLALTMEDPDAPKGTFTHWMVLGLPGTATSLERGAALPTGAMAMKNGKGNAGYTGPCPPQGNHHYVFKLYALDIVTPHAATPVTLSKAIEGHVLGEAKLTGMYAKHR